MHFSPDSGATPAKFSVRESLLLAVLVAGQVTISLDFWLAGMAIPSIGRQLAVSPEAAQWVISGMALGFGGFLIVGGRLTDIYGQRKCLIGGLALYTFGAVGSGLSGSMAPLIGFRALQGLGGAIISPATLSLLFLTFAEGAPRFRALTISMAAQFLLPPVGVILAGRLITEIGWQVAFLLTVPPGLLCLTLVPLVIPNSPVTGGLKQPIDLPGAVLSTLGFSLLVWSVPPLVRAGMAVPPSILTGFAASILVLAGFILLQIRLKVPLVAAPILRTKNLVPGLIVSSIIVTALAGLTTLSLVAMQQGLNLTPMEAGVAILPYSLMSLMVSLVAPRLAPIILRKPHLSLAAALSIVAGCHFLISLAPATPASLLYVLAALALAPLGGIVGLNLAMSEALKFVPREHQGTASALVYTGWQVVLAIGVALMIAASEPAKLTLGAAGSLVAFAGGFRIGAVICLLGIGISLFIRQTPSVPVALLTGEAH